jgi:D-beta-D-heptose 7-phosphate kinase/D-beta-D-heptose 1-phosphate adenosyltransferase
MKQDKPSVDLIYDEIRNLKAKNKIIGFANGCFDLLHDGHLHLIKISKKNCDFLIIGLNSDDSVSRLKGTNRPIENQNKRYENLSTLNYVDKVIIFDEDTPIELIEIIRPDIIFKGSDYKGKEIVGGDLIKSYGGKVFLVSLVEGISTTKIIETKVKR